MLISVVIVIIVLLIVMLVCVNNTESAINCVKVLLGKRRNELI